MDEILAILFAVIGLTDMALNDCPTGCLAQDSADRRLYIQTAGVQFNGDWLGSELVLGYDFDRSYGPFQPTMSVSTTHEGAVWAGVGAKWRVNAGSSDVFFEGSLQPGLYVRGDGPELGSAVQFRSALGIGYEFNNGGAILMSFDHRSNGDFQPINPGLETLSIQYSFVLD
jgi:lipid A 3-O-deacylase